MSDAPRSDRERIAVLEEQRRADRELIEGINDKLDRLLKAAWMGQGAWWLILRLGGVLAAIAALAGGLATLWRTIRGGP